MCEGFDHYDPADDEQIPDHVMAEWLANCDCCRLCTSGPCDGVKLGDHCEQICECDPEDYEPDLPMIDDDLDYYD